MKKHLFLLIFGTLLLGSCAARVSKPQATTNYIVVKKAPKNSKVVFVEGKKYYRWNGKFHRKTGRGYLVVTL